MNAEAPLSSLNKLPPLAAQSWRQVENSNCSTLAAKVFKGSHSRIAEGCQFSLPAPNILATRKHTSLSVSAVKDLGKVLSPGSIAQARVQILSF